jgi:hypothetical protein
MTYEDFNVMTDIQGIGAGPQDSKTPELLHFRAALEDRKSESESSPALIDKIYGPETVGKKHVSVELTTHGEGREGLEGLEGLRWP